MDLIVTLNVIKKKKKLKVNRIYFPVDSNAVHRLEWSYFKGSAGVSCSNYAVVYIKIYMKNLYFFCLTLLLLNFCLHQVNH